ncbi:MAG TPA: hypothetical protein VMT66_15105 [Steroidobacteraceae bacterium]|nr:hypothetical protein [Steroidobacteraceae bacterium]
MALRDHMKESRMFIFDRPLTAVLIALTVPLLLVLLDGVFGSTLI